MTQRKTNLRKYSPFISDRISHASFSQNTHSKEINKTILIASRSERYRVLIKPLGIHSELLSI